MADKEKKEEIKKDETKQVQKESKKEEKPKKEATVKKEEKTKTEVKIDNKKEETKKQDQKPENKKFEVSKQKTTVKKEKNNTSKKSKIPAILTVVIVLAIVAVLTVLIVTSSDPKKSVDGFLTNLKAGDFEKAQEFATGDKLLEDQEYNEETQKLLFDKISWKVKKVTADNNEAKVEIEITNKDFSEVLQNYKNKIWKDISSVIGKTIDTSRYFEEELKNENLGTKTITTNIKLQKQDGKWKVVANNELANSLLPGLQESVDAIQ
ncbi:MAG: hypothetical protein U0L98_07205 [Clostridia bacterium]|nr:hypothetical protein [Clostridia bacterium]